MVIIGLFSGIGALLILFYFLVGLASSFRAAAGALILVFICFFSFFLEINAKNKVEITENIVITDYIEITQHSIIKFHEPVKVKIIEYNYPDYSALNPDRSEYHVIE